MTGEPTVTVVGNLTADPDLRFTPAGAAVLHFTVASTPRVYDRESGEWTSSDTLFLRCSLWRQAAENAAQSLARGMRVIVQGRLKQRSFETKQGDKRTVVELDVDAIGPELRYASAKVSEVRGGGTTADGGPWQNPLADTQDEVPFLRNGRQSGRALPVVPGRHGRALRIVHGGAPGGVPAGQVHHGQLPAARIARHGHHLRADALPRARLGPAALNPAGLHVDAAFTRIQDGGITFFADPACQQAGRIYRSHGRRGTYFRDPNGHLMEILTPAA
jgi:single-strand DNA-binding protein